MSTKDLASSALAPAPLPAKSSSSRYVNNNLAQAVRDSVHIASKSHEDLAPPLPSGHISSSTSSSRLAQSHSGLESRAPIAIPRAAGARPAQPELPSDRLVSTQNPFDDDLLPSPTYTSPATDASYHTDVLGSLPNPRTKLSRSTTAQPGVTTSTSRTHLLSPTSPPGIMKTRRSLSTDTYGLDVPNRELTAGQRKALEDKKGSRHADVIDTWDPTGLGSAMWHHSGPYDAAAPSRNKNLPDVKAPMRAFPEQAAQAASQQRPPQATAVQLETPPTPPAKDPEPVPTRRAPAPVRERSSHSTQRRTSGGLTGQYSTSVPSGGYFASVMNNDERLSEAEIAQRDRQREREQKRRALKAAWGIDEPEPFEDFGGSPGESTIDLDEDVWSPGSYHAPIPGKPVRSPSGNFDGTTPPILENSVLPSNDYLGAVPPRAGVKRTKSLMQRIKTMREHNRSPNRSASPRSPSDPATPEEVPQTDRSDYLRPGFFSRGSGRTSPQRQISTPSTLEEVEEPSLIEPMPESNDFVIVESPDSKARARRALEQEAAQRSSRYSERGADYDRVETLADGPTTKAVGRGARLPKTLPTPPVGPVLPDFEDLMPTHSREKERERAPEEGIKRKPSMVKKLKDRIK